MVSNIETMQPRHQGQLRLRMRDLMERQEGELSTIPYVYSFASVFFSELWRSFGLTAVYGEEVAAIPAAKKVAPSWIALAEAEGYSSDVCGYHEIEVGRLVGGMRHPFFGDMPPPKLVVVNNNCVALIKWGVLLPRHYDVPQVTIDVPYRPTLDHLQDADGDEYHAQKKYVLTQIEELISILERITGKKFDPDKLAEHEAHSNRMADLWTAIHRINREIPAVYDATLDGMNMQALYIGWRGTREGAEYLEVALRELEERRELGIMPLPQERFRLILDGVPCWPSLRSWAQLFHRWNACFVWAHFMSFAPGGMDRGFRFDTSRPVESMADYELALNLGKGGITNAFGYHRWPQFIADYKADGIVFHATKGCRVVSPWMPSLREHLVHQGIPAL